MADNVAITAGAGTTIAADEVVDGTLGTVKAQFIKLMDGTLDGTAKAKVNSGGTPAAGTDAALLVEISSRGTNANGIAQSTGSAPVVQAGYPYEDVPISSSNVVLGGSGAAGDYLEALICFVDTAASSQVSLKDGSNTAVIVLPASVGGGVGTYYLPMGTFSASGAWQVTTGAGVRVRGVGKFT